MKKNNSNLFPLITGLLAGGAAVYFLKSEKGKQMIDIALKKGENMKSTVLDNSKEIISTSKDFINSAIQSGTENIAELAEEAKDSAQEKLSEFEKGINNAKKQIAKA